MLNPFPDFGWEFTFCPSEPNWSIDWTKIIENFEWLKSLDSYSKHSECYRNALFFIKRSCEILVNLQNWQELPKQTRSIVFLATLLQSTAKATYFEDFPDRQDLSGRQNFSDKHLKHSARLSREILWEINTPFYIREMIVNLIAASSLPFYIFERLNPEFSIIKASQKVRLDWLSIVSQVSIYSDNYINQKDLLDKVELFIEFAKEQGCFDSPKVFPSPHSRFVYFQKMGGDPNYFAYDNTLFEVILMCGLPASGKDTWIKTNLASWPVISLDEIRKELKIQPHKNQGEVISESKERARVFLREKKSFVWNATNTMFSRRSQLISLFTDYKAHIKIVYLETTLDELFKRNHKREETVPKQVVRRMLEGLEIPDLTEAHQVEWVIN
jgi:predicted kinase